MSERFIRGRGIFTADNLLVQNNGETLSFCTSDEGSEPEFAFLNVADVRRLMDYLSKVLPESGK